VAYRLQVVGIATVPIPAKVVKLQAVWDRPDELLVGDTVRQLLVVAQTHTAVTL
jgi:hypothetical protein